MSDRTFERKKAATSTFSNPSLVSPHTPTLANPERGFGLPTNNIVQAQTVESANQQAAQAADEKSKLLQALEQRSFGHELSRIAVRPPQAKLTVGEPGDKYEQEADWMANQVMRMPDPAPPVQPEALSKDDEAVQSKAIAISSVNDGFLQQKCSESEQAAQSTDEQSLLSPAIQQRSFGHDLSRIAVRPPQAKLTVGEPGDKYEQEADWMANQVMRMVVPDKLNAQSVHSVQDSLQRKCAACEEEEDKVQTKPSLQPATDGGLQAGDNIESRLNSSKGGGSPLAPDVRSFMEPRFGADFSGVQVHTGSDAVQMNRELNAQAFTHGSDVYFGAGKSAGNNELTAHELTHVVQQNSGIQAKSNIQAEILQRDCDPTLASCPPDQTTTLTTPGQTKTPAPGPTSDDYKQGYQDGLNGGESQAVPRDGDALTDYNEGYAKGHYEFTQGSASPAPATPETDQQPAAPVPDLTSQMSIPGKLYEAASRGLKKIGPAAIEMLQGVSPESLAIAMVLGVAVAQGSGIGQLAAAILSLAEGVQVGQAIVDLSEYAVIAIGAQTDSDLDSAGAKFAAGAVAIGVLALFKLIGKLAKMGKGEGEKGSGEGEKGSGEGEKGSGEGEKGSGEG
ncbi:MAG: eCIS core domain-containing protein, partial [Nostoc sp.]